MAHPKPLLNAWGIRCGLWSCVLAAASFGATLARTWQDPGHGGLWNDFYDYWAAGRALWLGGDPYDKALIGQLLHEAGVHSLVGTGYSYPLLMAELARPLALLPPGVAATFFTAGGLCCLGLAMALLLSPVAGASPRRGLLLATAAGLFVPIDGTLYVGQVNIWLLPLVVLAFRGVWRSGALAGVAAVKLYPAGVLAAFATDGRRGWRPFLAAVAGGAALTLLPNLLTGTGSYGGSVLQMFAPDPYWSNQSVNGWLSRVATGLPVTPLMLGTCALLGGLALLVIRYGLRGSWQGAFALALGYSVIAAPKNSIWNFAPMIVVLVYCWTLLEGWPAWRLGVAAAWLLMDGQDPANAVRGVAGSPAALAWLTSLPLYGGVLVTSLLGAFALRARLAYARAVEPAGEAVA
jgi:hypothetical protein